MMNYMKKTLLSGCFISLTCLTPVGCANQPPVIPAELESQLDRSISYRALADDPGAYRGRLVLLGGEVLGVKRLQGGTELELLQLPVQGEDPPSGRRLESQGRFLALDRTAQDPASYPPGTRVTVIGEVSGETVRTLDESTYRYPTLDLRHLYSWDPTTYRQGRRASPLVGMFGSLGFGYGSGGSGSFGGIGLGTGF